MVQFVCNTQYVKDLSFENPKAPYSLTSKQAPKISLALDVRVERLSQEDCEVTLLISAEAKLEEEKIFVVELSYAGLFTIRDAEADEEAELTMVEAPTLLFPFARRILAETTRDGGLPPLVLEPVNFFALYQEHRQKQAAS
jgi:preprotein translocase subunit SecB